LKNFLSDWQNLLPLAGLVVLAAVGIFFWLRRKPPDAGQVERERRAYLNRVGRIVEGQVLEVVEHLRSTPPGASEVAKRPKMFAKSEPGADTSAPQRLLYYTYAISGVTYETAQDITGLEERLHLTRVAAGQTASVKYDPSNPSNSILLADDWSGLH
jgi:LPXTG-motif cell wall-anchored protein